MLFFTVSLKHNLFVSGLDLRERSANQKHTLVLIRFVLFKPFYYCYTL